MKKIVYSIAALTALPVATQAAEVDVQAQEVSRTQWGSNADTSEGTKVIVNNGSQVSQTVTLAKGKYQLKVKNLFVKDGDEVTITVAGISKSYDLETDEATIDFTLNAETEVALSFSSKNNEPYAFGTAEIVLQFDFDEAKDALNAKLWELRTTLNNYTDGENKTANLKAASDIEFDIDDIEETYAAYTAQKLYDITGCPIAIAIEELKTKAAADENEDLNTLFLAQIKEARDKYTAAVTAAATLASEETAYGKIYEKIAANAQTKLATISGQLSAANTALSGYYGESTLFDNKADMEALIYAIGDAGEVLNEMNGKKGAIDDVYAQAENLLTQLNESTVQTYAEKNIATAFGSTDNAWQGASGYADWATNYRKVPTPDGGTQYLVENYVGTVDNIGNVMVQTVEGLTPGTYRVVLYGNAAYTAGRGFTSNVTEGDTDVAYLFATTANGTVKKEIPAHITTVFDDISKAVLNGIEVGEDGIMTVGLGKEKAGTNWHIIQISEASAVLPSEDAETATKIESKLSPSRTDIEEMITALIASFNNDNNADEEILNTNYDENVGNVQTALDEFIASLNGASEYAKTVALIESARNQLNNAANGVAELNTETYNASAYAADYVQGIENALTPLETAAEKLLTGNAVNGYDDYAAIQANILIQNDKIDALVEKASEAKQKYMLVYNNLYGTPLDVNIISVKSRLENVEETINSYKVASYFTDDIQNLWDIVNNAISQLNNAAEKTGTAHWDAVAAINWNAQETLAAINNLADEAAANEKAYSIQNAYDLREILQAQANAKVNELTEVYDEYVAYTGAEIDNAPMVIVGKAALDETQTTISTRYDNAVDGVAHIEEEQHAPTEADLAKNQTAATNLQTLIDQIETLKESITTAKTAAEAAVQTSQENYDAYQALIAKTEEVADAINEQYNGLVDNPEDYYSGLLDGYERNLTTILEGIDADYNAGNSVSKKEETEGKINELLAKVQAVDGAAAANKAAYDRLKATVDAIYEAIDTQNAGLTDDPSSHYSDLLLEYTDDADELLGQIQDDHADRTAVAKEEERADALDALLTKVNKVDDDAAANLANYNSQLEKVGELQPYFDEVYDEIEANNENLENPGTWLEELDAIKPKIQDEQIKVVTTYTNAESTEQNTTLLSEIADIKAEIAAVYAKWSNSEYDDLIAEENAARKEAIKLLIDEANKAFTEAVSTQDEYANVTNEALKAQIETNTSNLTEDLYTYPTKIQELLDAALADYEEKCESNEPFNLEDEAGYIATAQNYIDAIHNLTSGYQNNVLADVDGILNDYTALLAQAEADIADYADKAKENAFEDVETLIAEADAALAAKNVLTLDSKLNALESTPDLLADDKNAAAVKDLQAKIDERKAKSETELAELNDLDESTYKTKGDIIAFYEEGVENTVKAAQTLLDELKEAKEAFDRYDEVTELLGQFDLLLEGAQAKVNEIADALATWEDVNDHLAEVKAIVDQYYVAADYSEQWEEFQEKLNSLNDGETGMGTNAQTVEKDINDAFRDAKNAEKNHLNEALADLKKLYNNYAAYDAESEEKTQAIADLKTGIDKLEEALSNLDLESDKAGEALIELESDANELYSLIHELDDSQEAQDALAALQAELNDAVAALGEKIALLDEFRDEVKEECGIADAKAEAESTKSDIEAEIAEDTTAGTLTYNKAKIESAIEKLDGQLDGLIADATDYQERLEANETAYACISADIQAVQDMLDAAIETVDGYELTEAENYFRLATTYITNATNDLETQNENMQLTEASNEDGWLNDAKSSIKSGLRDATIDEASAQTKALENARSEAYTNLVAENYSQAVLEQIEAENEDISNAIDELNALIGNNRHSTDADGNYVIVGMLDDILEEVAAINERIETLANLIQNSQLGDVTGDGKVTAVDYTREVNYIIGKVAMPEEGSDEFIAADINEDGEINVGDVTALVNIMLTGDRFTAPNQAPARGFATGNDISVESTALEDGITRFALMLTGETALVSAQMDIVLPQGMRLVGESLGERAGKHSLASGSVDGAHRIVVSSLFNKAFSGNEGAVVYLDVKTDGNYNGEAIDFLNIYFADEAARIISFNLEKGDATAIAGVETQSKSMKERLFDYGGRLLNRLTKGFNIIQGEDGKTKKVYVK